MFFILKKHRKLVDVDTTTSGTFSAFRKIKPLKKILKIDCKILVPVSMFLRDLTIEFRWGLHTCNHRAPPALVKKSSRSTAEILTTNENACSHQFQPMNAFVVPQVENRRVPTQHREAGPLKKKYSVLGSCMDFQYLI